MREMGFWVPVPDYTGDGTRTDALFSNEGDVLGIVEQLANGWSSVAIPPEGDVPDAVRGGFFGERIDEARAWCERMAGLELEQSGDRHLGLQ